PHNHGTPGKPLVYRANLEFIKPLFERAAVAHLVPSRKSHREVEGSLKALIEMSDLNHAGPILIPRPKITGQIFDGCAVDIFSGINLRQRECEFARTLGTKTRNT